MAKNCINRNFKTSEASTKAWMRTRNLIDKYLNILDINGFREANQKWSKYAQKEYNTEGLLFAEENNKALPNKEAFQKIDETKGITYQQRSSEQESITRDEFEKQRKQLQSIIGWDIVYDRTMEEVANVKGKKIVVNPDKIFRDTLVHEVGHVLIDAIGGLNNPLVRRGIEQLKGTALANKVQEEYSDQPQEIIDKEILATAIGLEGADIFGKHPGRISKWKKWLDLFLRRVQQVLGIEPNVARDMAREIIFYNPEMTTEETNTYQQRDYRAKNLEDKIEEIRANMKSEISILEQREVEDYQDRVKKLKRLVEHLQNAYKDVAVSNYINLAEPRLQQLVEQVNNDNLSVKQLRQIKEDLSPYENITELQTRLNDIKWEHSELSREEVRKKVDKAIASIEYIRSQYMRKVKEKMAEVMSTDETGRVHRRYKSEFQDEFDQQNTESRFLGFRKKRYIDGEQATKGEYNAAKNAYVQEKMDQYRDKIEQEEYEYLLDVYQRTPNDLGFVEHFAYDSGNINDEIIQTITYRTEQAENEVRGDYLDLEQEIFDIYQEFKQENDTPLNQQKRWDFMLPDKLDREGNPTGEKAPFIKTGEFNPSFLIHKRELNQAFKDAKKETAEAYKKLKINKEKYEQEYNEAVKRQKEAKRERDSWIKKNTKRIEGTSNYIPIDKWKTKKEELNETQQKMKDAFLKMVSDIDSDYSSAGKLTYTDRHIGDYINLPNVPKTAIEKLSEGDLYRNTLQTMKEIIHPRQDDLGYESISQETVKFTRDNKLHRTIPIYFRGNIEDQSFDLPTMLLLDRYMAMNYKAKSGIEAEILALKDISVQREIGETRSILGKGEQEVKNFVNNKLGINIDTNDEISRRHKVIKALVDAKLYGIRRKGNDTVNKVVDNLISATSMSILPFNLFSMISNVVMGKATTIVEIFGDNMPFDRKDFLAAEQEWLRRMPGTMADAANPKNQNFIMKLVEMYDAMGDFSGPTFDFIKDSRFKQSLSRGTLYALQTSSENYIGVVFTLASLRSMRLQNKDGKYINTEGKVVKDRDSAATMLDYLRFEDGQIVHADLQQAYKTDMFEEPIGTEKHNFLVKSFIRDSIAQTQGQYDTKTFSLMDTNIFGRMFANLRGWMFRGIDRNWRGAGYVFADEIPEHVKLRSRSGAADEIGYQTQFFHTLNQSRKQLWKFTKSLLDEGERLKFDIVSQPWKDLSPSEQSRVRKAVVKYAMYSMAVATASLLKGMDDDEEELPDEAIYLIYALTRTKQELLFYTNPLETMRILRSPAASVSMIRSGGQLLQQASSDLFSGEFERYQRGQYEGRAKLEKDITDLVPVYSQFHRDVRSTLSYIESMSVGS